MAGFGTTPKDALGVPIAEVIVPGNATPVALKGGPSSTDANSNTLAPALVAGDYGEQASLAAGSLNADLIPSTDVSAYKSASLQITGTWSGTLSIQASNDNSTWQLVNAFSQVSQLFSSTFTANDFLFIPITFRYLRVRMTSYVSGTANGTAELYTFLAHPFFLWSAQSGTWTVQPGNTQNTTPWLVSSASSPKVTYVYAISATAPYATPTDWIVIRGSGSKTVKIVRIEISGAATAATEVIFTIKKHTVANTAGTSTTPTPMQHDSNDAAASATVLLYSVAPTISGTATIWKTVRMTLAVAPAATTVNPDRYIYDYASQPYEPLTLRGVAQECAINFAGAAVPTGGVYDVAITFTEE